MEKGPSLNFIRNTREIIIGEVTRAGNLAARAGAPF